MIKSSQRFHYSLASAMPPPVMAKVASLSGMSGLQGNIYIYQSYMKMSQVNSFKLTYT